MLNRTKFMASFHKVTEEKFQLLLCAVLALSAMGCSDLRAYGIEDSQALAETMFDRAKGLYFRQFETGSTASVQGLILMAVYCDVKYGKSSKAFVYLGAAHRHAIELGMNLDISMINCEKLDDETKYIIDRQQGIELGRPMAIRDEEYTVEILNRIRDPALRDLHYHAALFRIVGRIAECANVSRATFSLPSLVGNMRLSSMLLKQLDHWRDSLPAHLAEPTTSANPDDSGTSFPHYLHLMYYTMKIIVLRIGYGTIDHSCAWRILRLLSYLTPANPSATSTFRMPLMPLAALTATSSFVYTLIGPPIYAEPEARRGTMMGLQYLKEMQNLCKNARGYCHFITDLLERKGIKIEPVHNAVFDPASSGSTVFGVGVNGGGLEEQVVQPMLGGAANPSFLNLTQLETIANGELTQGAGYWSSLLMLEDAAMNDIIAGGGTGVANVNRGGVDLGPIDGEMGLGGGTEMAQMMSTIEELLA
ncbi:hypothetical protein HK104_006063 [Borealophlyctis nickersoniae]|nr:hypothetical protein HK104_006063 [Borealophlyctis nickersoniae]